MSMPHPTQPGCCVTCGCFLETKDALRSDQCPDCEFPIERRTLNMLDMRLYTAEGPVAADPSSTPKPPPPDKEKESCEKESQP